MAARCPSAARRAGRRWLVGGAGAQLVRFRTRREARACSACARPAGAVGASGARHVPDAPCLAAAGMRACTCKRWAVRPGHVRGRAGPRTRVSSKLTVGTPMLSAHKQTLTLCRCAQDPLEINTCATGGVGSPRRLTRISGSYSNLASPRVSTQLNWYRGNSIAPGVGRANLQQVPHLRHRPAHGPSPAPPCRRPSHAASPAPAAHLLAYFFHLRPPGFPPPSDPSALLCGTSSDLAAAVHAALPSVSARD